MFSEIYNQVEKRRDTCLDSSIKIWNGKEILKPVTSFATVRKDD